MKNDPKALMMFWGCFVALITTAFAFVGRLFLINVWAVEFDLDPAQAGRLAGIGVWPFAVSIILFSLVIDKIGYKTSMFFAAAGHIIWAVMGTTAYFVSKGGNPELAFSLVYWGSFIVALANGTVEAFINPVVATMFNKEKTKWLNILHAGWPGGLVLTGVIVIFLGDIAWWIKVALIALPTVAYTIMLMGLEFPKSERETAGVSYREMLQEFGILGAVVVGFLMSLQLMDFFPGVPKIIFILLGIAMVAAFGIYTKALGRGLLFFLILIMMPLATTELGTDGWITAIMEGIAEKNNFHPGWVLVYTSVIMLVLRFFAGPIVQKVGALGLLAISAILAILGLYSLSITTGMMIFAAATLYGIGKTFFWPTMLGVVAEQTPKGGALTLNAIAGIGMLAVGTLGFPYIGVLQTQSQQEALVESAEVQSTVPGLVVDGKVTTLEERSIYELMNYQAIDEAALSGLIATLPAGQQEAATSLVGSTRDESNQRALGSMTIFPIIMLICYIILILYFKSKGGYKPIDLGGGESAGAH